MITLRIGTGMITLSTKLVTVIRMVASMIGIFILTAITAEMILVTFSCVIATITIFARMSTGANIRAISMRITTTTTAVSEEYNIIGRTVGI